LAAMLLDPVSHCSKLPRASRLVEETGSVFQLSRRVRGVEERESGKEEGDGKGEGVGSAVDPVVRWWCRISPLIVLVSGGADRRKGELLGAEFCLRADSALLCSFLRTDSVSTCATDY